MDLLGNPPYYLVSTPLVETLFHIFPMPASGLSVGLNAGHITARRELKVTPSYKKGVCIF
jgi:hypothetical protein